MSDILPSTLQTCPNNSPTAIGTGMIQVMGQVRKLRVREDEVNLLKTRKQKSQYSNPVLLIPKPSLLYI